MPHKALSVCPTSGCPALTPGGRCAECKAEAEKLRGSASSRGYGSRHRSEFRDAVLRREPSCRLCGAPSTVADHWPIDRKELVRQGLNPNDPTRGRGLCATCHGKATQAIDSQRGGWNAH